MNPQKLIAPAIISALLFAALAQPASAGLILTDSWSIGSYTQASGSKPTFTTNAVGNSNLGGVTAHPITNPFTQTLTLNTPTTNEILFVAVPPGSGAAAIPVNFTLSDTTGGTAS